MSLTLRRMRPATIITSLAVGGVGAGLLFKYFSRDIHAESGPARKVFGRGPAFVSLPLESSEAVNHNTKRLRFALPHSDDVSGLTLTCNILSYDKY